MVVRKGSWIRMSWVLAVVAFGAIAMSTPLASAQKKAAAGAKKAAPAKKGAPGGPKPKALLRIDAGDTVKGTIQKPEAFYVLPRTELNFEGLSMKKSFVSRIIEAARKAPF